MKTYVPDTSSRIVHYTSVDFTKRTVQTPIHLVQYDSSLPIIAITLMEGTNAYSLPADGVAELRYGKNDYTFVIADALGQSADGTIVYFEITYQMTVESGEHHPVVSIWVDDKIAASSTINIIIDRNPVQNEQISSLTDYTALRRFRNEAKEAADNAKKAAEEASKNATQTSKDAAQTRTDRETIESIITGQYAFTATINVTVTAAGAKVSGAIVTATLNGKTYTATTNSSGVAAVKVYYVGTYAISATYRDYAETSGSSVTISTNEQIASGSVAIFGATLTVDADISGRTSSATNTITVTDGTHKQTATITANGSKVFTIYYAGTYTVSMTNGTDTSASVSVDCKTDGGTSSASISYFKATLTVKVINGNGATVTATDGAGHTYTGTATSGTVALTVYAAGTYTVSSKLNGTAGYTTKKVDVTTNGGSYSAAVLQSGATFSAGSDEVIGTMIDAAQAGDLDLSTVWSVGDTRTITVSAFAGVENQHAAQSIDIVITSFEDYNGAGAVMQFDMKDCLAEYEYMNSSNTGTLTNTSMYKTVLPNYANALPSWLKTRLKPFSIKVSPDGSNATPITLTNQKLALRAEWEVFGAKSYAVAGQAEASGGKQISYYATQANRIKKQGHTGSADTWWLRSPYRSTTFCYVESGGTPNANYRYGAEDTRLVAPFGCV